MNEPDIYKTDYEARALRREAYEQFLARCGALAPLSEPDRAVPTWIVPGGVGVRVPVPELRGR